VEILNNFRVRIRHLDDEREVSISKVKRVTVGYPIRGTPIRGILLRFQILLLKCLFIKLT
jgi:hypothetical protein